MNSCGDKIFFMTLSRSGKTGQKKEMQLHIPEEDLEHGQLKKRKGGAAFAQDRIQIIWR
jgi:hypothetical protein